VTVSGHSEDGLSPGCDRRSLLSIRLCVNIKHTVQGARALEYKYIPLVFMEHDSVLFSCFIITVKVVSIIITSVV